MNETNVEQLNQDLMEDQNTYEEEVYDQTSELESKSGKEALVGLLAFGAGVAIKTGFDKLKGKFVDEETQKQIVDVDTQKIIPGLYYISWDTKSSVYRIETRKKYYFVIPYC